MILSNARLIFADRLARGHVRVTDGKIAALSDQALEPVAGEPVIDLGGQFLAPGFIDIHIHGAQRRDAMEATADAFAAIKPTFETASEHTALGELYSRIDDTNFSHQVLAVRPEDLMVMKVADVGWSDLGEPNRVLSTLAQIGMQTQLARSAS